MSPISHPYLQTLYGTLSLHYKLCECLQKRIALSKENYATKSEYEQNEIEISNIKTQAEIDSLRKVILAREEYFRQFMQKFAVDAEEADKNMDNILVAAKNKASRNPELQRTLDSVNWDFVATDMEAKVKLYNKLKDLLA